MRPETARHSCKKQLYITYRCMLFRSLWAYSKRKAINSPFFSGQRTLGRPPGFKLRLGIKNGESNCFTFSHEGFIVLFILFHHVSSCFALCFFVVSSCSRRLTQRAQAPFGPSTRAAAARLVFFFASSSYVGS